jgi:hypothetical protein
MGILFAMYYRDPTLEIAFSCFLVFSMTLSVLILRKISRPSWWKWVAWVNLSFCFFGVCLLLVPSVARVREASPQTYTKNQMKQLALAMHSYADSHDKRFPPHAVYSKDGRPLLSWRVLMLPYLEQEALYQKFHLDESWDSPHNIALLSQMPSDFAPPAKLNMDVPPNTTYYQVFVGPGTAFEGEKGLHFREDFPGFSNPILIVEAGQPVPWTKPKDLVYEPGKPLPSLGGIWKSRIKEWHAVLRDASIRVFTEEDSEATIRNAITRKGGN